MDVKKFMIAIFSVSLLSAGFSSCKKKCVIEKEDINSGVIIDESNGKPIMIYPSGGYQLSNMGGDWHIHAGSQYDDRYEVSFDGGVTKGPVDYNTYNILGMQTDATCEASFEREVIISSATQTVNYNIIMTKCAECDESIRGENYVLVPAFPETYTVNYNLTVNEVN